MKGIIAKAPRPFKSLVIHLYPDLDDVSRWDGAAKVIHERSGDVVSTPSRKVLQTLIDSYFEAHPYEVM
jgi:hypothetical protein